MTQSIFEQRESSVRSYCRSFPTTFSHARGAEVWNTDGRRYLDFLAGCGSLNYGHNHPALKQALLESIESDVLAQGLDMQTNVKEKFLYSLQDIILKPRKLDYLVQMTGPTGTNAVEAAMKLSRKATGRSNIVFFTNGYHGVSLGALAATGNSGNREGAGVPLTNTSFMPYDGYLGAGIDTLDYFEKTLEDASSGLDKPAAVIVETIQGEGGLRAAELSWLVRLQSLCSAHGVLLIVDDIQAGCGRGGTFFSFEPAGITPDIVTLSKSISGYGLPLSLVLHTRELDLWKPGEHNGTFRGNNHALTTATAALETFWSDDVLAEHTSRVGATLYASLDHLVSRFRHELAEVRGRGMMRGIEFRDPAMAACVASTAFDNGLIIERSGSDDEVVKCLMPINISEELLKEGLSILEYACHTHMQSGERFRPQSDKRTEAVVL